MPGKKGDSSNTSSAPNLIVKLRGHAILLVQLTKVDCWTQQRLSVKWMLA